MAKKQNEKRTVEYLVVVLVALLLGSTVLFGYSNLKLRDRLYQYESEAVNTQNPSAKKYEHIRAKLSRPLMELKSNLVIPERRIGYSFYYPDNLISKPNPRGFPGSFAFYATEEDFQNHEKCIKTDDPEVDWEMACDLKNLLFTVSIGEDDYPQSFDQDEVNFLNANNVAFKSHLNMYGGMGDSGYYHAITTRYNPTIRNWGIKVTLGSPNEAARQQTRLLTGLDDYQLFKNILSSMDFKIGL